MKALVSIQFAIELDDEDQLVELAQMLDRGLRGSIENHLAAGMDRGAVELFEIGGMIDWYGASVAVRRSVFAGVEGGE
jgi:hypothetical protein